MRIGIHASHLNVPQTDGVKVFLKNLILNIKELDKENQFFLYYKAKPAEGFIEAPNYKHVVVPGRGPWTQLHLPRHLFKDKLDAFYIHLQTLPFYRPKMRTVITIHDIAFFDFPEYFTVKNRVLLYLFSSYAIRSADKIITPSFNTKNDITRRFKVNEEKIVVAPLAYNKNIFKPVPENFDSRETKEKYKIKGPYILYIGVLQPRKNIARLIRSFNVLKKKNKIPHQLVLVGSPGWLFEDIFKEIAKSPFKKDIIQIGEVKWEELPKLLWAAEVFVLPSLYEGFGLPVLEALASGTPVITARNSSLPEVGGEAAEYIENAKSEKEIAEKILKVISNENLREEMRQKGFEEAKKFSWEKCAKNILQTIKDN